MNQHRRNKILQFAGKKLAVAALIAASAVSSFATLGDGKKKTTRSTSVLTANKKTSYKPGSFSLRSGFTFRGSQVMNTATTEKKVIRINTTVTLQRGSTTFTMPLNKNVVVGKIQFGIRNGTISNQR
jgi:hypothetical protein